MTKTNYELFDSEIVLIEKMRNEIKYGEITIQLRDGKPYKLIRVEESIILDDKK